MKKIRLFSIALLFLATLFLASCADMFQERVEMQKDANGVNLATMFKSSKTIDQLDPPAQIFVSDSEYPNQIIVSWSSVQGARSYKVERAVSQTKDENGAWIVPDESEYETLERSSFVDGLSYTDTIIDGSPSNEFNYTNEAYASAFFYRVSAENLMDNYESSLCIYSGGLIEKENEEKGNETFTKAVPSTLLTPPQGVKASGGKYKDKIDISWVISQNNVSSYKIWRSTNPDGSGGTQIATVYGNENGYSVNVEASQQGIFYYFTVVAVGKSGKESVPSSVALGYALKGGAPSQVEGVEITSGRGDTKNSISIKWQAASGSGTINYRIFRYSSADSSLKQLKDNDDKTSLTYEDKQGLKPNVFYYYQIQAYSSSEETGELVGQLSDSDDSSANPAEGYVISAPQNVIVQKIDGNISQNRIIFSAALGSSDCILNSQVTKTKADFNSYTYIVYGSASAAGPWTSEAGSFSNPTKYNEQEGYYVETVSDYKFYRMSVKNGSVESELSNVVAPAPFAASAFEASKNAALQGYTDVIDTSKKGFPVEPQANANGVHAIKLTWKAPIGGADGGYHVYRSTKPDSGFKKITESPVTDTYFLYKDEQAKAGNYYYYRVLSLNSLGQGANYSNTDYGYGALTTYQYVREYIKTTLNSQKKLTLMHKSGNTAKLGSESANGDISGSLSYNAKIDGFSGRVLMHYTNYADYYIMSDKNLGVYFLLNGDTNTSAGIDTNGTMDGTVDIQGMYPGSVGYNNIKISGGAAGGGTYGVNRKLTVYKDEDKSDIQEIYLDADWTWGEK